MTVKAVDGRRRQAPSAGPSLSSPRRVAAAGGNSGVRVARGIVTTIDSHGMEEATQKRSMTAAQYVMGISDTRPPSSSAPCANILRGRKQFCKRCVLSDLGHPDDAVHELRARAGAASVAQPSEDVLTGINMGINSFDV